MVYFTLDTVSTVKAGFVIFLIRNSGGRLVIMEMFLIRTVKLLLIMNAVNVKSFMR